MSFNFLLLYYKIKISKLFYFCRVLNLNGNKLLLLILYFLLSKLAVKEHNNFHRF